MTTKDIDGDGKAENIAPTHKDWAWNFWKEVPLYPYGQRRTIRKEVVPDAIWTFDQIQGIFYFNLQEV